MKTVNKDKGQTMKKIRIIMSYHRECKWLEEMSLQGWIFRNVTLGFLYTFEKGEPERILYDTDRFDLSGQPTLEEIRHKEMFLEMAEEMGWQEVTHDESLTYYFCKKYVEGEINELHNDEESRRYRAEKYRKYLQKTARSNVYCIGLMAIMTILFKILQLCSQSHSIDWFVWFALVYIALFGFLSWGYIKLGDRVYNELRMSRAEWEFSRDPCQYKTVRRLLLTKRMLDRFLRKQAEEGWSLKEVTSTKYTFSKSEEETCVYTFDSEWLVNKRRKEAGQNPLEDKKDWGGRNHDWQLQSVHDAEEKGWRFVCALENRSIIYKGEKTRVLPLNDAKYDNQLRFISIIGKLAFFCALSGLVGGIIGFIVGFNHL